MTHYGTRTCRNSPLKGWRVREDEVVAILQIDCGDTLHRELRVRRTEKEHDLDQAEEVEGVGED